MSTTSSSSNSNNNNNNNIVIWNFRPSVLSQKDYSTLNVEKIKEYYIQDNEKAQRCGITIPSHPSLKEEEQPQQPQQRQYYLRTLQWNLQAWTSPKGERNRAVSRGIMETILDCDADVLVLNEYHWRDSGYIHQYFEKRLVEYGYRHSYCGKNGYTPTLVASKYPVLRYEEIVLSPERSALCMKIQLPTTRTTTTTSNGNSHTACPIWIIGTHLDAFDGRQRNKEMRSLLDCLTSSNNHNNPDGLLDDDDITTTTTTPVMIMGDFNQQRMEDYTTEEWNVIRQSMDRRTVCHDDGVSAMLQQHNFTCVFNQIKHQEQQQQQQQQQQQRCCSFRKIHYNWEHPSLPPSTHWSGTTIDYQYSRNMQVHGVYVSPAGFSDHRMTVCDWVVPPVSSHTKNRRGGTARTTTTRVNVATADVSVSTTTTETSSSSSSSSSSSTRVTNSSSTAGRSAATALIIVDEYHDDDDDENDGYDEDGFSSSSSL
jgi:endonuclease/exonuclease/phosphatase family metal-dependent hydrolase